MVIESTQSYEAFYEEVADHDLILHVVPSELDRHASVCQPIAVFINDTQTNRTYTISFTHPDVDFKVDSSDLINRFSKRNNRLWALDKKSLIQTLPIGGIHDINLLRFIKNNTTFPMPPASQAHFFIKTLNPGKWNLGSVIPLFKHKEMFDETAKNCLDVVRTATIDGVYNKMNTIVIETLAELEHNGIAVDERRFKECFDVECYKKEPEAIHLVFSQYNIYTATGRPSNRFGGLNYAALKKDDGCRKCFTSRHNQFTENGTSRRLGKLLLVDYSAFHPRIICNLINFDIAPETDIYQYLGELYFPDQVPATIDIDTAKKLTFRQLYGGVEKQYEHIKYFNRLRGFVDDNWRFFIANGYVETPIFKRKITADHIQDPNPCKLFNYILQATETETMIPVINKLNEFLRKLKTKAILYTYDSVLFDFCYEDGKATLSGIIDIMRNENRFPIKTYLGDNYDELNQIFIS